MAETCFIALLRGINVGGKNLLAMKDLSAMLSALGAEAVKTYVQSGNAVFRMRGGQPHLLAKALAAAIAARCGFTPEVLVLSRAELQQCIAANPFAEAVATPARLHLGFLAAEATSPNLEKLEANRKETEQFRIIGKAFYLHAADGVGNSKLAAGAERWLGVPMTMRNWNTVSKLAELSAAL